MNGLRPLRLRLWAASLALLVLFAAGAFVYRQATSDRPHSLAAADQPGGESLVAALYRVEAEAAHDGWTPARHRRAGDARRTLGDLPGAVAHWSLAAGDDPARLEQLARAYVTLEHWPDALDTLDRLVALEPGHRWARWQLGMLLAAFDPWQAEAHLRQAAREPVYAAESRALIDVLTSDPADPLISMRVGLALAERRRWSLAEQAFQQAARVGHPYPEALAYVALARERQSKDGSRWMRQALTLGVDVPQVQFIHGLQRRAAGEYESSRDAFIQAVRLDPNNPAYFSELGTAYHLLFDYERAQRWLRLAVQLSGDDPRFQERLAVFYAQEGYHLPAVDVDYLRQSVDTLPPDPDLLAGLAWTLYSTGDSGRALAQLELALVLDLNHPQALYYTAQILLARDDISAARPLVERLARLDSPHAEWAEATLASHFAAPPAADEAHDR